MATHPAPPTSPDPRSQPLDAHPPELPRLELQRLYRERYPALTRAFGRTMADCSAVVLEEQGHTREAQIAVTGEHQRTYLLTWHGPTPDARRCHHDQERAAENGAYRVAILLIIIVEKSGAEHTIRVPLDLMDDLVKPNRGSTVQVDVTPGNRGSLS